MNRNSRPCQRRSAVSLSSAGLVSAALLFAVLVAALSWLGSPTARAQSADATATPAATATPGPSTYKVQVGDSWISVAARNGVSVAALKAANPRSIRQNEWLLVGESLVIPEATPAPAAAGTVTATQATGENRRYVVGVGESWNSIAQKFGVSAKLLQAANPRYVRAGLILYRGDELVIPPPGASEADIQATAPVSTPVAPATAPGATVTATATAEATAAPTATEAVTATVTTSTTEAVTSTEPVTAGEAVTAITAVTTAAAASSTEPPPCPTDFAAYPDLLSNLVNAPYGGMEGLLGYLRKCKALDEKQVKSADWNGDGTKDLAAVIVNPNADPATPQNDLLIFMSNGERYDLAYRARAAGKIKILATEDINKDGKPDIAWVDTTCGASTCIDTVGVRSWDGKQWADWTGKPITMAEATIQLVDARDTAQGKEIKLTGGVYGSVGAGPQRGRTELWGSVKGAPYSMIERVYERSACVYHKVLDANEALQRYQEIGLVQAKEMYTEAVTSKALTKCWDHPDELSELRSFSLFRLALISAYQGKPDAAAENIDQLKQAYPDSIFTKLGEAWLAAYQPNRDIAAACAAATQFATANPQSYEGLSAYGYGNPTFKAEELCPVLNIDVPAPSAASAVTGTESVTITEAATATEAVTTAEATTATEAVTGTETVTDTGALTPTETTTGTAPLTSTLQTPAVPGQEGDLPACPANLGGYNELLPKVIEMSGGDTLILETWLRLCNAMADDRGGMLLGDFNGDGLPDALFMPTIVSDVGFGPKGAQGAVLIYHGKQGGGYDLVYSPEIYGQPALVTSGDLAGTGRTDLVWTVEGCSTFCIKEVQIVTWDPDQKKYVSIIEPGATIAEGKVSFEDLPAGAPGKGKQLVLSGGVSGTADGGLAVPHKEIWQTVNGKPFRRISWTYDRKTANNDCLGLRLVEADAALQASDILGYGLAATAYQNALDPALKACSIYSIPADQELQVLRGLASFRLIQTQALSGTLDAAKQTLATLTASQPDTSYTKAATQWLDTYAKSSDPKAACQQVQPIFDKDTVTWQFTDHFGYNHPAMAAEQVCFVPRGK